MSSNPQFFLESYCLSGLHGQESNISEHILASQSQEKEAIAASVEDLDDSTYRSPSRQSDIEALRDLEDGRVLELLSIIRQPGYDYYPYPNGLPKRQYEALVHLECCHDRMILLWLKDSRGWKQLLTAQSNGRSLTHSDSGGKPFLEPGRPASSCTSAYRGQWLKK